MIGLLRPLHALADGQLKPAADRVDDTSAVRNGQVSFWYASTSLPRQREPLPGDVEVDVCIVGGGFTGLWAAYYLKRDAPHLSVAIVERMFAGYGASGRNGGWLSSGFSGSRDRLARQHGDRSVMLLSKAMQAAVDEVLAVCDLENIDADQLKSGKLTVARNPAQVARLRSAIDHERRWLPNPQTDVIELTARELRRRLRMPRARAALWSPHGARIQPAKLVQGLAAAVERLGVTIFEGTSADSVSPGRVYTDRGTLRATYVLTCLEGFSASLRGQQRTWLPLNSAMIVTAPLSDYAWEQIGWDGAELVGDASHAYMYSQRTADGRIALGGRGVPYRFASRTDRNGETQRPTVAQLSRVLRSTFGEAVRDAAIEHAWCGVLGVPRDWTPTLRFDASTRMGLAGGYVGSGVATANLAGRTMRDLVLGQTSSLIALPWVGRWARRWEPEPLRWVGTRLVYGLYRRADEREARNERPRDSRLATVAAKISGR